MWIFFVASYPCIFGWSALGYIDVPYYLYHSTRYNVKNIHDYPDLFLATESKLLVNPKSLR